MTYSDSNVVSLYLISVASIKPRLHQIHVTDTSIPGYMCQV